MISSSSVTVASGVGVGVASVLLASYVSTTSISSPLVLATSLGFSSPGAVSCQGASFGPSGFFSMVYPL